MLGDDILHAFQQGDKKAFDVVYSTYSKGMYAICLRYSRCADDAQDMLQEAFIKIYNSAHTFDHTKQIGPWVKTIVINTALTYIKQHYRFELKEDERYFDDVQEMNFDLESSDEVTLMRNHLLEILQQLPDGYRTVFNLFVLDNLTHKEIAHYLGISESTSKSQFFKAKRQLQLLLNELKVRA